MISNLSKRVCLITSRVEGFITVRFQEGLIYLNCYMCIDVVKNTADPSDHVSAELER